MRTVIVQGLERMPDGGRRTVEIELILSEGAHGDEILQARIVSAGAEQTGTGVG